MHSSFSAMRSSLPMNLRTEGRRIAIWSAAQADIDRITEIWRECLDTWQGPWLFGRRPTVGGAMYAPVVTRIRSYAVQVDTVSAKYCEHVWTWPDLEEWIAAARLEPEQIEELEVEF
jgi:glutathione S-transferase